MNDKKPSLTFNVLSSFRSDEHDPSDEFNAKLAAMNQAGTLSPDALEQLVQETTQQANCLGGINYESKNTGPNREITISFWSRHVECPDGMTLQPTGDYRVELKIARDTATESAISGKQRSQAWMRFVTAALTDKFKANDKKGTLAIADFGLFSQTIRDICGALDATGSLFVKPDDKNKTNTMIITLWPKSLGDVLPTGAEFDGVTGELIKPADRVH